MFEIENSDLDNFEFETTKRFEDHRYKHQFRDLKYARDKNEDYTCSPDISLEIPTNFPPFKIYDKEFGEMSFSFSKDLIPSKIVNLGVKNSSEYDRSGKVSKLRPVPDEQRLLYLYYYDEYGNLDLSTYVSFLLASGVPVFRICIMYCGKLPYYITLFPSDFVLNEKTKGSSSQDCSGLDIENFSSLQEYLIRATEDCVDNKIVLDVSGSCSSMRVFPGDELVTDYNVSYESSSFGGASGYWISLDFKFYIFKYFLTDKQFNIFSYRDWTFSVVSTLYKDKFVITPVKDEVSFADFIRVHKCKVRAIEICHKGNDWKCDVSSTYRSFEARSMGLFVKDKVCGLKEYFDAYTFTPFIRNSKSAETTPHVFLPCGICPKKANGHLKGSLAARKRAIYSFNYGVVCTSTRMEPILGSQVYVTDPSYGIRFVKYKTPAMLPTILNLYKCNPELCQCTFNQECFKCRGAVELNSLNCVSMFKGRRKYDWSDRFNMYCHNGQYYVYTDLSQSNTKDNTILLNKETDTTTNLKAKYEHEAKTNLFLVDLYKDYINSDPISSSASYGRTRRAGVSQDKLNNYLSIKEKRFFSILTMFSKSHPRRHCKNLWMIIQSFFGKRCEYAKIEYDKAVEEFAVIFNTIVDYDNNGFISDDDVAILRDKIRF